METTFPSGYRRGNPAVFAAKQGLGRVALLAAAGLALSACTSSDQPATPLDTSPAQPRIATYSCADGGNIRIEFLGTAIRLLLIDGTAEEFPANPAGQQERFSDGPNAVVIEGSEALIMHGNQTPLTCVR